MSVWSMAAVAILAGAATGAVRQEAQVAQPAPSVTVVAQAASDQDQEETQARVSVSFNHATVGDVMDWLTKNGLSFVAADSELPKDATITLNVKDEPINEVADAIASALGGHWERRGGMRIFRKGEGMFRVFNGDGEHFMMPSEPGAKTWTMPKMREFKDGDHVFVMPNIPDMKEFKMPDIQIPDMKNMPGMDEESRKEMERALEDAHKEMLKSGDEMKISRKAMEEARKAIEKARKEHPEAFEGKTFIWGDGNKFLTTPNGDGKFFVTPDKKGYFYRLKPGDNRKSFDMKTFRPSMTIDGRSFTKFVDSLSPDQRELKRRQGYLRASDLTENQRKMLGISGRDKGWSITINKDGEEVTIKSD